MYKYLLAVKTPTWTNDIINTYIVELEKPIDEEFISKFQADNKNATIISFSKFE